MLSDYLKISDFDRNRYLETLNIINQNHLNTVCIEANCPNRYECFSHNTATFMILGDICTRNCKYCNIRNGTPKPVDKTEPRRILEAIKKLRLNYVVVTCVTRDDLEDGGASHFVEVIRKAKELGCKIEVLISDLNGNHEALKKIIDARPDVINHNIEVVKRLFPKLRPKADYNQSLAILQKVKEINNKIRTKSGLMVGLGETKKDIIAALKDLKLSGCENITIGQYLQPSENHAKVMKYYSDMEFQELKEIANKIGFKYVNSGKLVRSSYHANQM